MDHQKIITDLSASESEAAFIAAANAVELQRPTKYFVNWRTVVVSLGEAKADAISAFLLAAGKVNANIAYTTPGDELGDAGGVDIQHETTTPLMAALVASGVLTVDDVEALKNLGATVSANCQTRYGVDVMTTEVIAQARQMATNETLNAVLDARESEAQDIWNTFKSLNDRRREYLNTHLGTISAIEELETAVRE